VFDEVLSGCDDLRTDYNVATARYFMAGNVVIHKQGLRKNKLRSCGQ
jgi:hypothetical protein